MNRLKSIYSIKNVNYNNNIKPISTYINYGQNKSITRINNFNVLLSSNNTTTTNATQIREFGFLTNIYSNFKNLFSQDPEYEKMIQDFDRIFLNNRIAKKKEKHELEEKIMEEKMAAYSKSAEQRAKEEANLSEEEIHEKRKEEQRIYEELIKEKEKQQGFKKPSFKMAPKGDEVVQSAEQSITLKKVFELSKGVRPLPFDIDREEPDFSSCQDWIAAPLCKAWMPNPEDVDEYFVQKEPFTLEEQFDLVSEFYTEPLARIKEIEAEARSLGVVFDPIDWDDFYFTEEQLDSLPVEFNDFIKRKCYMEFGKEIEEEKKEKERKKFEEENKVEIVEHQGRELSEPDNPSLYPVFSPKYHAKYSNVDEVDPVIEVPQEVISELKEGEEVKATPPPPPKFGKKETKIDRKSKSTLPWYLDLEYYIPRFFVSLFNRGDLLKTVEPHLWYYHKRFFDSGTIFNTSVIKHWDEFSGGLSYRRLLKESFDHFLPNFFYHFFQGNLRELEPYTTEWGHSNVSKKIKLYEGDYKILCGDVIRLTRLQKLKFIADPNGGVQMKVTLQVYHTVGYRDYSGDIIEMSEEDQNALYRTAFKLYLVPTPDKNRFGWSVRRIIPGNSYDFKILAEQHKEKTKKKIQEKDDEDHEEEEEEKVEKKEKKNKK